jgi:hypothetical protein
MYISLGTVVLGVLGALMLTGFVNTIGVSLGTFLRRSWRF